MVFASRGEDCMNRIGEVIFCLVGMAGFVWFINWLVYSHSQDFQLGLATGVALITTLHLAYYLLCKYTGRRWDGMG
jgi:low affinity Fe/Cu permease